MIRRIKNIVAAVILGMFCCRGADALFPDFTPLLPMSPQFCVMCTPAAISMVHSWVDQGTKIKDQFEQYADVTKLKQQLENYGAGLGKTKFNQLKRSVLSRKKIISSSRTIEECREETSPLTGEKKELLSSEEMDNEKIIKDMFIDLFLQYPSDQMRIMNAYRRKGDELKMNTAIEAYVTAMKMSEELYGISENTDEGGSDVDMFGNPLETDIGLIKQLAAVEKCLMQNEGCEESGIESCYQSVGGGEDAEDRVCFWNNAHRVARIYDTLMRYNEYLSAMQAQYRAVMSIGTMVDIMPYQAPEQESSLLEDEYLRPAVNYAYNEISADIAFADKSLTGDEKNKLRQYNIGVIDRKHDNENLHAEDASINERSTGFYSIMDERYEDFESQKVLDQIRQDLAAARNLHNMKQMLPKSKQTFVDYDNMVRLHDKTVKYLQDSGECIKNHLDPYYKTAAHAWFGDKCDYYGTGYYYCHYPKGKEFADDEESAGLYDIMCPDDEESKCYVKYIPDFEYKTGIAGYLVNLYDQAQIEDALSENDAYINGEQTDSDIYVVARIDGDVTEDDMIKSDDLSKKGKSEWAAYNGQLQVKDQEKADALQEENRKNHLINWVLGAEVAGEVAHDLESVKVSDDNQLPEAEDADNATDDSEVVEAKFGKVSGRFPLWTDQKEFYEQYIDGKYKNMEEYVDQLMQTGKVIVNIAAAINELTPYDDTLDEEGNIIESAESKRDSANKGILGLQSYMPQLWGVKTQSTRIYDEDDKLIGQVKDDNETVVDFDDNVIATLDKDGNAVDEDGNIIGHVAKLGEVVRNQGNGVRGYVDEKDKIRNFGGKIIGYVDKKGRALDIDGRILGTLSCEWIDLPEEFASMVKDEEKQFAALENEHKMIMNKLLDKKKKVYEELDELNTNLDELNREHNTLTREIVDSEKTTPLAEEGLTYSKEMYAQTGREDNENSPQNRMFREDKSGNERIKKEAPVRLKEIEVEVKALEEKRDKVQEELKAVKNEIEEARKAKVLSFAALEREIKQKYSDYAEEYKESQKSGANIGKFSSLLPVGTASSLMQCFRDKVVEDIHTAKDKIDELKADDELYYMSGAPKVWEIHQELMDNITHLSVKDLVKCSAIDAIKALDGDVEDLAAPIIRLFSDICDEASCYEPDDRYFVSLVGQKADFSMPKAPDDRVMPALREILHFDLIDYNNTDKYYVDKKNIVDNTTVEVSSELLLNSSLKLPDIWHDILKRHSFVQKDFDIKHLLANENTENENGISFSGGHGFLRSGIFPCRIGKNVIDVSWNLSKLRDTSKIGNAFGYARNAAGDIDEYEPIPDCLGFGLNYRGVIDIEADANPQDKDAVEVKSGVATYSELGHLLSYLPSKDKLTFNQHLQTAMQIINQTENINYVSEVPEDDAAFFEAKRAFFDRNQFGDYLEQYEQERKADDSLKKVEIQINELKQNLREVFFTFGYTFEDGFTLLNEEDYKTAETVLKRAKRDYIDSAKEQFVNVNGTSNNVKNKLAKLQHEIKVLEKDKDELVYVGGDEDLNELEERIKTQQANQAVEQEYFDKAEEAFERQLNQLRVPYCAVYRR